MFKDEKRGQASSDMAGYIGKGMLVEGRLSFDSTVRVDGDFKGEICARGTLVVGEGAHVDAEVKVDTVIVTGELAGVIEASKRVEIQAPGKVLGEVRTPNLIIGDGAIFEGNCTMLRKEGTPQPTPPGTVAYGQPEPR